jgi:hypothetical protein
VGNLSSWEIKRMIGPRPPWREGRGLYIIKDSLLQRGGSTMTGTGVTFFLTGRALARSKLRQSRERLC